MKKILAFFIVILFNLTLLAQSNQEFTVGPVAKTNGLGMGISFKIHEDQKVRQAFSMDVATLKHSKEVRIQNDKSVSPKTYFYGKQARAFTINPSYQIFSRMGMSGRNAASIGFGLEAGPSFAFLRPIYLIVLNFDEPENNIPKVEEYDPESHTNQDEILGDAGWQKGFDHMTLRVGIHSAFLVNIDFDQDYLRKRINAGVAIDYYFTDLGIMYHNQNKLFGSVFIRYQIGRSR